MSNSLWSHGLYGSWNFPGQNTGVGSLSFLQGIFSTQGSNSGFPHCRQVLYQLSHKGSLIIYKKQSIFLYWPCNLDELIFINAPVLCVCVCVPYFFCTVSSNLQIEVILFLPVESGCLLFTFSLPNCLHQNVQYNVGKYQVSKCPFLVSAFSGTFSTV